MNSILYTSIMVLLWILNLLNDSGLGQTYQTTAKMRMLIMAIFLLVVIVENRKHKSQIRRNDIIIFGAMICVIGFGSFFKNFGYMGFHYTYVFLLIYIMSRISVKMIAVKMTGLAYVCLGMGILYIYAYGSILSGWNGNTIGMIGLYSFLIFLISYYDVKSIKSKIIVAVITVVYSVLIAETDSRASILFAVIAVLFAFSILPKTLIVKNDRRYYFWLLIPLLIAILVVAISHSAYMERLDAWSVEKFQKTIFNGRDKLWESGFSLIYENLFFGGGSMQGNWHNCMITMFMAYGCVGGALWIMSIHRILAKGRNWIADRIVSGSIITFIIMYIQQSVELGLVSEFPNILPYVVLGMMLGRVKYLKECVIIEK